MQISCPNSRSRNPASESIPKVSLAFGPVDERDTVSLVKFCRAEHNIVEGCPTIHLGTLDYYRSLEGKSPIGDAGEGRYQLSFEEGVKATITDELSERAFGGAIKGEGGPLEMAAQSSESFLRIDVSNCYLFCASLWPDKRQPCSTDASAISPAYDSMYEIVDPQAFQQLLTTTIANQLAFSDLTAWSIAEVRARPVDERYLWVHGQRREVEYLDKRAKAIRHASDLAHLETHQEALDHALYTKEKCHAKDREFRFVFMVADARRRMLSVKEQPMLISSTEVARVCRCVTR